MSDLPETPGGNYDLAAFVLRQAEEKARGILADARRRASQIEREAYAQARRRLDLIKQQERARARESYRQAEARMHARLAGRRREIEAGRLEQMRARFASTLEEFWRDPVLRDVWLKAAIARAKESMAPDGWTVELSGAEESELSADARGMLPRDAKIAAAATPGAGVRIRRDNAVLDATAAGFLAQGARLDALLLAALADRTPGDRNG